MILLFVTQHWFCCFPVHLWKTVKQSVLCKHYRNKADLTPGPCISHRGTPAFEKWTNRSVRFPSETAAFTNFILSCYQRLVHKPIKARESPASSQRWWDSDALSSCTCRDLIHGLKSLAKTQKQDDLQAPFMWIQFKDASYGRPKPQRCSRDKTIITHSSIFIKHLYAMVLL